MAKIEVICLERKCHLETFCTLWDYVYERVHNDALDMYCMVSRT